MLNFIKVKAQPCDIHGTVNTPDFTPFAEFYINSSCISVFDGQDIYFQDSTQILKIGKIYYTHFALCDPKLLKW